MNTGNESGEDWHETEKKPANQNQSDVILSTSRKNGVIGANDRNKTVPGDNFLKLSRVVVPSQNQ